MNEQTKQNSTINIVKNKKIGSSSCLCVCVCARARTILWYTPIF